MDPLISSVSKISVVMLEHPKNWFTVFLVYEISLLLPEIIVPEFGNETVESTVIVVEPTGTFPMTFVSGVSLNFPIKRPSSSYPSDMEIL